MHYAYDILDAIGSRDLIKIYHQNHRPVIKGLRMMNRTIHVVRMGFSPEGVNEDSRAMHNTRVRGAGLRLRDDFAS